MLFGYATSLPAQEVVVGDTWQWKGNVLDLFGCQNTVGTFTLKEILEQNGERCARIVGSISGWPQTRAPRMKFACETIYSLDRQRPVSANLSYDIVPYNSLQERRIKKIRVQVEAAPSQVKSGKRQE
jgi:hypothetical protein